MAVLDEERDHMAVLERVETCHAVKQPIEDSLLRDEAYACAGSDRQKELERDARSHVALVGCSHADVDVVEHLLQGLAVCVHLRTVELDLECLASSQVAIFVDETVDELVGVYEGFGSFWDLLV